MTERSRLRAFISKVMKDNVTMLASVVAWGVLSSVIPIVAGLIAISSFMLSDPTRQRIVIDQLSQALQQVLSPDDLRTLVQVVVQHTGLLGILGVVGVLWGASAVGGAISTVFQPIFQVRGRPILQEKLLDIGMIFVFTILMLVILTATTAGAILDRFLAHAPLTGASSIAVGTMVSLLAAFLLFFVIYAVFPNIQPRFRVGNVWKGALIAALLFQGLSYVWPVYALVFHPQRYGAVLAPIVILGVWIYFFSLILVLGAEVVAFSAIAEARAAGEAIGPAPDGTVPQRIDRTEEEARHGPDRALVGATLTGTDAVGDDS
jgi:membrane protein